MDIQNIKQLTCGFSFTNTFKILDHWDEIADNVLYKNPYFNEKFFTNISADYTTQRSLFNPDTGNSLVLTANNLIFTQKISEDFSKVYEDFKSK